MHVANIKLVRDDFMDEVSHLWIGEVEGEDLGALVDPEKERLVDILGDTEQRITIVVKVEALRLIAKESGFADTLPLKRLAVADVLEADVLVEKGQVGHVLIPLRPELPLEQPAEHLHVEKVLKEGLLVGWRLVFVPLKVEAGCSPLHRPLARLEVLFVVLEQVNEEVEEAHSYFLYVLRGQRLPFLSPGLHHVPDLLS